MLDVKDKGVLLTGAKRVGRVIASRLARDGVRLVIGYRNSRQGAEALRSELAAQGTTAYLVQGDLSIEEDVKRMVSEASDVLGGLHFAINLASGFPRTPFETLDGQVWDTSMADAKGSYLFALHASRTMMRNPGPTRGHIVLFSDAWVNQTPYWDYLPYLTAKAAIDFLSRVFAVELAPYGILVNAVAPGPTMRPPGISDDIWRDEVLSRTPLKRESAPEDIAEVVAALLKTESITGETIRVDAGVHLAGSGPKEA
ncbi:MAG: SDR family oxidoreductase [SAR202 cluster bacterium]|nr:SDR family oxidoreductase [SAR202 cluster bacterium]